MITFKQFLSEEDHSLESAARFYVKNCSDWVSVAEPLWRLANAGYIQVREPRDRYGSVGETGAAQEWIFQQDGWEDFPNRKRSIFCSTSKKFEVGNESDRKYAYGIYPVNGTKLAITEAIDFNYIKPFKDPAIKDSAATTVDYLIKQILFDLDFGQRLDGKVADRWQLLLDKVTDGNGVIDEQGNGWNNLTPYYRKMFVALHKELPEALTPKRMGCSIVTSESLPFGKQHEVWFEGKYLAVPSSQLPNFKGNVKLLQAGKELPAKQKVKNHAVLKNVLHLSK